MATRLQTNSLPMPRHPLMLSKPTIRKYKTSWAEGSCRLIASCKISMHPLISCSTVIKVWRGCIKPSAYKYFSDLFRRFVRDRVEQQLEDCVEKVEQLRGDIERKNQEIEAVQAVIANIEKEIHESGSRVSNLRDNLRVRKLEKQIIETQANIDSYDMEEAARARRNFDEKYTLAKKEENDLNSEASSLQLSLVSAATNDTHSTQILQVKSALTRCNSKNGRMTSKTIRTLTRSTPRNW